MRIKEKCVELKGEIFISQHCSLLVTVVLMRYMETPVPIPNTEVKHILVDDTGSIRAGKVG